jgi:hypothetical protein
MNPDAELEPVFLDQLQDVRLLGFLAGGLDHELHRTAVG